MYNQTVSQATLPPLWRGSVRREVLNSFSPGSKIICRSSKSKTEKRASAVLKKRWGQGVYSRVPNPSFPVTEEATEDKWKLTVPTLGISIAEML